MRRACRVLGTLLIGLGIGGILILLDGFLALPSAPPATIAPQSAPRQWTTAVAANLAAISSELRPLQRVETGALDPEDATRSVGNRLVIPRIGIDAPVVASPLTTMDGVRTWDVPAFAVGHAAGSADAGQAGNVVLVGHINSLHSGDVFARIDRLRPGDRVEIYQSGHQYDYTVVETRVVARTDLSVVQPTSQPTATLITCAGVWLPSIRDYTQRFVVRAAQRTPAEGTVKE